MEEIESVHGEADSTSIKDIEVRFVLYDATIPTLRKLNGSVNRPDQKRSSERSPCARREGSIPNIDKDGDESDA
jgi:hypothetical protein